jgi:hypothetical protein
VHAVDLEGHHCHIPPPPMQDRMQDPGSGCKCHSAAGGLLCGSKR